MKKNVLMIAHFCSDFDGNGNNRFNYIADLLSLYGYDVELVTTDFSHSRKKKRCEIENHLNFRVTMCHEPIYIKNVSLKRFYSHYIMGQNLKKYLEARKNPDVIYCAVPSLDVAEAASEYARVNNVRFIIDIQDLWPEAFKMVFNVPLISDVLFYPMNRKAEKIYRSADEIIAVSQTYVDKALQVNNKARNGHSIFLGTELKTFDKLVQEYGVDKSSDEIWLGYVGTLGHSYDLTLVIDALAILRKKGINNIKFIVMGDGPLKPKFENHARNKGVYAEFTGMLPYGRMVGMLAACDIAVNAISKGAAGSIINKHADYAAAGLPVLNTQESPEYRNLISEYNAGFNCENENAVDLAEKLFELYSDESLRLTMGRNSRRLAEEKFDRFTTYQRILEVII